MFFLFLDDYGQKVLLNGLKFGIQALITSIKVEFEDKIDPMNRFEMAVALNNR